MCTYVRSRTPQIAEENIKVAKLFFQGQNTDLDSICVLNPCNFNDLLDDTNKDLFFPRCGNCEIFEATDGVFHSYTDESVAHASTFEYDYIVECFIPKGTEYWKSIDGKAIVSRKLLITKKIL